VRLVLMVLHACLVADVMIVVESRMTLSVHVMPFVYCLPIVCDMNDSC
jgi:hypothetical protein